MTLSKGKIFMVVGYKFIDINVVDPTTGEIHFAGNYGDIENIQSCIHCYFVQLATAKERSYLHDQVFHEFYDFGAKLAKKNSSPCLMPHNMSAIWKLFGLGGGCKNANHLCYCCEYHSNEILWFTTGNLRCSCSCKQMHNMPLLGHEHQIRHCL